MKIFNIVTGILSILSLIDGIWVLFNQPMETALSNDRLFASIFLASCSFILLFLYSDNCIHGTINKPKN